MQIYYSEYTEHQDTYGMNYGLRQRNAGYWQLSKRVHNTKELELSGKGQITAYFDCLRYGLFDHSKNLIVYFIFK